MTREQRQLAEDLSDSRSAHEQIDLWALLQVLWDGKWIIISSTIMSAVVAIVLSLLMPNIYRSEALLAPADESNPTGLMALAGQLGGVASLAGVDLGKVETTKVTVALEVLKSRAFISSFIKKRDILAPLLAAKGVDSASGRLIFDNALYDESRRSWVGFGEGADARPGEWKAYQELTKIMRVSQAKDTGLIRLSIDHVSPEVAQQWVAWLIEDVNEQLRKRDVDEANKSVNYLVKQLEQTPLADMKKIFYQLIEKQTQTIMLASVRDQYIFKVIDPPAIPEEKIGPRRASITIMSAMGAFAVSVGLVLFSAAYRNARKRPLLVEG